MIFGKEVVKLEDNFRVKNHHPFSVVIRAEKLELFCNSSCRVLAEDGSYATLRIPLTIIIIIVRLLNEQLHVRYSIYYYHPFHYSKKDYLIAPVSTQHKSAMK
jgi:hypothetical protein